MKTNLVNIRLHHELGDVIGSDWNLNVSSVKEAIHAIQSITNKLYSYIYNKEKAKSLYQIIVNGRPINNDFDFNDINSIKNSELNCKFKNLKTIDIIPVLEGADSKTLGVIVGAVLIIIGVFIPGPIGTALIIAGIGLIITALLLKPPKFEDFREIDEGGKVSYLFNGPANIVGEGGPVPILYGDLMIGSQTVTASYVAREFEAGNTSNIIRNIY